MLPRSGIWFLVKKWTFLILCLVSSVLAVVFAIMAKNNIHDFVVVDEGLTEAQAAIAKSEMITRFFITTAFMVLFKSIGIGAALFEHIWTVTLFIFLNVINIIMVFGVATLNPAKWINFTLSLIIVPISILFWIDLKKRRQVEIERLRSSSSTSKLEI